MSMAKRFISRTVLAKVYANDKCASRLYSHSPVLPDPCGPSAGSVWRKVSRPQPPEFVKGLVHYEVAVENDIPRIIHFWETKLGDSSSLLNLLGAKPADLLDLIAPVVKRSVKEHSSLLGFVRDELIGISMHSIREVTSSTSNVEKMAEILPSKNYKKEIESAPFPNRTAQKFSVFWSVLSQNFEELVPGAKKVMFLELGGIAPEYQQRGIAAEMVHHAIRMAKEQFHCDHVLVVADTKPSQKLYEQKLGFKLLRELKLDHFYDGEACAFPYMNNEIFSGKLLGKEI